ncbi:Aminodeoxyfutalosine deaminase [Anatilimnocola aggregata]|uniref:Aminodeoxyfutalosine deaminase n=1 Tax=Anatilimnocola aggregata TaxID=2528021 RepID=A0A517YHG3_9BACT|nr:amidohydrolase family protein [Anatilimnocola aggregata]QDU29677.1 Aminodeoxyfutalosine deaminase [Anatilimnocola aggregata]
MDQRTTTTAYRARWVFPVERPPIEQGVVTVANGLIVGVGQQPVEGAAVVDLGNVALLPGLINAHTHLEFSLFNRPFGQRGTSFATWLKQVVAWRREQPAVLGQEEWALAQGLNEVRTTATAAIGEIATPLFSDCWRNQPTEQAGVIFLELLSLNPERVAPLLNLAVEFTRGTWEGNPQRGLSPHAPYTVHPELLAGAVELSRERQIPLTMHLAESREELELLDAQTGPLVELLHNLAAWYPESLRKGTRPLDYLRVLTNAHHALIAHGNYLQADEIAYVAEHRKRLTVVYCPRTQAYFDHDPYPLLQMLHAGARVAVGTDSRASNPDLSVWKELQQVRTTHANVSPEVILTMGTIAGAEALGKQSQHGTLSVGKRAELTIIQLPNEHGDAYEALFSGEQITHPIYRTGC